MSAPELLVAYLRQRVRGRLFVPLALVLAFGGWCLTPAVGFQLEPFALASAQAFLLVLAFRVWDDLEDRDADRARHPNRVMEQSRQTAPFVALIGVLTAAVLSSLLRMADPLERIIALAAAVGVLSLWYSARRSENWNRRIGSHVVLLKYPLIAYTVAPVIPAAGSLRPVAILVALYLLVCVYEYVDDPELRQVFTSWRSLP